MLNEKRTGKHSFYFADIFLPRVGMLAQDQREIRDERERTKKKKKKKEE